MADQQESSAHRGIDQDDQSGNATDRPDQDGQPGNDTDTPTDQDASAASSDQAEKALQFEGNTKLLELLNELYPRQRRDQRHNRPLICLVRHQGEPAVLPEVHRRIKSGLAIIKEINPDARNPPPDDDLRPATVADVTLVRDLLVELANRLGQERGQHIRRFRRFALTTWLMNQELPNDVDQDSRERAMRALLRTRNRYQLTDIPNDLGVPPWLWTVAIGLTAFLYRARISGRVPVLSGHYRWFLRRVSLAPRRVGGMPSVAAELTSAAWRVQPNATLLFLVNSFIEDIRAAYRSPFRRIFGTRRTAYCLILISNVTRRNGGYHLLRAINEVRNLTGLRDPLLLVTESHRLPPFAKPPAGIRKVSAAHKAYGAWKKAIARARDEKKPTAWFLPLVVPPVPESDEERNEYEGDLAAADSIVAPREPHYRKAARLVSMAALIAGAVFGYAWWSHAHCGDGLSFPGLSPTVSTVSNECVGLSDDPAALFSPQDEPIRQLAQQVRDLNLEVQTRRDNDSPRPVITLVYLGALNTPGPNTGALAAEVEGLRGVTVAQRRQLDAAGSAEPMVKVLFANAGQRMTSGTMVARIIGAAARSDPTLVGVVGLNQSFRATEDTVNALANQGIPTVAATLSADSLADNLEMYFQIAPQNRREAAVAASYAAQHPSPDGRSAARKVRIYFSDDPSDIYSSNLAADAVAAFRERGFEVKTITFTPDGNTPASAPPSADLHLENAAQAGADGCDFPGLVFYAGRALPDFGSFLGTARNCATPPRILADDDVARYAANDLARRQYPSIPFDYLAFSATTPEQAQVGPEQDFYRSYDRMFPAPPGSSKSLDGYAALAYDASQTFVASVQHLRSDSQALPISPGTVWRQISAITGPGLRGASGYIDFGGRIDRRVPMNKPVLVMRVADGEVQREAEYCGPPPSQDPRTQPWCPLAE